jgi:hypothetical protein
MHSVDKIILLMHVFYLEITLMCIILIKSNNGLRACLFFSVITFCISKVSQGFPQCVASVTVQRFGEHVILVLLCI